MIMWLDYSIVSVFSLVVGIALGMAIRQEMYKRGIVETRMPHFDWINREWIRRHRGNLTGLFCVMAMFAFFSAGGLIIKDLRDENQCLKRAVGDFFVDIPNSRKATTDSDRAVVRFAEGLLPFFVFPEDPAAPRDIDEQRRQVEGLRGIVVDLGEETQQAIDAREGNPVPTDRCG